ncbi:hypothetical protein [Reinekea thalattae]|uniref:GLUG domain-containing protein n=1 Tax=Reinekea thalattae TaxID=2593301 RepID=A0A5C8ZAI9_9GAMM|nr:hypothetical protein [Reinekea thalattae]TXR53810.1 hypothetical protein FME95_04430 [Reinekea thalattae]
MKALKPLHLIFVCSLAFLVGCNPSSDNSSPTDTDGDGMSDNADALPNDASETTDTDGDGIDDNSDNCPSATNEDQADSDGDLVGNACDIDDNDNGLIEISSLEQLDWIRNNLAGTSLDDGISLNGSDEGCYLVTGCNGYELTQDLDFDTNDDGVMNADDTYYDYDGDSSNSGWLPIGTKDSPFTAIFEGNDYEIRNLYINRSYGDNETSGSYIGLFGYLDNGSSVNAEIRNIGLTGELMDVTGGAYTGGLVGYMQYTTITSSYTTGKVSGAGSRVGGLVGHMGFSNMTSSYTTGTVTGGANYTGGLVGSSYYNNIVTSYSSASISAQYATAGLIGQAVGDNIVASYATGTVAGGNFTAGLIGQAYNSSITATYFSGSFDRASGTSGGLVALIENSSLTASYWATDISNQSDAVGENTDSTVDATGAELTQLQCPTSANNITCLSETTGATLYAGWDAIDHDNDDTTDPISPWVFGDSDTLPTLSFD